MDFVKRKTRLLPGFKLGVSSIVLITIGLTAFISVIALRVVITLSQSPLPQAILVLEGNPNRIEFAARFAQAHPNLKIWVSGNPGGFDRNRSIFRRSGISDQRIRYDFCATDTVTNFTCTVNDFTAQDIRHLYLITSDHHMARSRAIAALVLGSRGIAVTPASVPSERAQPESFIRTLRDCIRSLVWIVTGRTGASLNPDLNTLIMPATPQPDLSGTTVNLSDGMAYSLQVFWR